MGAVKCVLLHTVHRTHQYKFVRALLFTLRCFAYSWLKPDGSSYNYLVFTTCPLLLLLNEVRCRCRRRSRSHAANDSDAVLRERRETQFLSLTDLYALQPLKPSECELKQKTGRFLEMKINSLGYQYLCERLMFESLTSMLFHNSNKTFFMGK